MRSAWRSYVYPTESLLALIIECSRKIWAKLFRLTRPLLKTLPNYSPDCLGSSACCGERITYLEPPIFQVVAYSSWNFLAPFSNINILLNILIVHLTFRCSLIPYVFKKNKMISWIIKYSSKEFFTFHSFTKLLIQESISSVGKTEYWGKD